VLFSEYFLKVFSEYFGENRVAETAVAERAVGHCHSIKVEF